MSGLTFDLSLDRPGFALRAEAALPLDAVIGVIGPSGAGKSSLLRSIAGLEADCSGRLQYQDELWLDSAKARSVPTHMRGVGMVFQRPALFDHLDVRQNLAYAARRAKDRAGQRADPKQLAELLGIEQLLDRRVQGLSGGEAQRVALARALASSPRLLLLDEPLAAVDHLGRAEVMHYLEQLRVERPVPMLYVSHNIDEVARLADWLVIMDSGQLLAQGPVAEMLTRVDLPLAQAADAEAVLEGRVVEHIVADDLTRVDCNGAEILLAGQPRAEREVIRLRIHARDVSLALSRASDSSILNILPCEISQIALQPDGQCLLRLMAGRSVLLARITQRSQRQLGLEVGQSVFAQIKSVALL